MDIYIFFKKTILPFIIRAVRVAESGPPFDDPNKTTKMLLAQPNWIEGQCRYLHWHINEPCSRPVLKGHEQCFWHVSNVQKYEPAAVKEYFGKEISIREAIETEVMAGHSLAGAFLREAHFEGNFLRAGANLAKADLRYANLSQAHLSYSSLNGANLQFANLESAYLSDADIRNADLSFARLCNAKFRNNDFLNVKGLRKESFRGWPLRIMSLCRIFELYPDQSEPIYRALIKYFGGQRDLDSASWAAYKACVLRHKLLRASLSFNKIRVEMMMEDYFDNLTSFSRKVIIISKYCRLLVQLLLSYLSGFTFGYGEKPLRVFTTSALVIFIYSIVFAHLNALSESGFRSALYFSLVTFTTLGYGDIVPNPQFRLIAASEAILGLLLVGLFLFTLARRGTGRG